MFDQPKFMFWPVGTGDSTSIVIENGIVLQVDLRHLESKYEESIEHVAIIDILASNLPKLGNEPYLAGFALTHPDKDHICGFEELNEKATIGEIWFTPRIFKEYNKDLCEDAVKFKREAMRRIKIAADTKGEIESGDRVRIIGYDKILLEDEFKGFPNELITEPGNSISTLDGMDYRGKFNAFIHAPFKDSIGSDRNDTSLAMQVVLGGDLNEGGVLFFGDLSYQGLIDIFQETESNGNMDFLKWRVLLAPHHCSKSAMYKKEDGKEKYMEKIMDYIENSQVGKGIIVSSSEKIPTANEDGDNPPHVKAKRRYEARAKQAFLCTHENGGTGEPLVFSIVNGVISYPNLLSDIVEQSDIEDPVKIGIAIIRGSNAPPTRRIGFGNE